MTWLKNNLWVLIIGVFGVAQVALIHLKVGGVIRWNYALVAFPTIILIGLALFLFVLIGRGIFDDFDDEDDKDDWEWNG